MKTKTEKKPGKTPLPPKPIFAAKGGKAGSTTTKAPKAAPAEKKPRAAAQPPATSEGAKVRKPRDTKTDGAQTKRAIASALLTRDEGATLKEILGATGWPSISIPQLAAASNLVLTKEKVKGSPTRYFGKPA